MYVVDVQMSSCLLCVVSMFVCVVIDVAVAVQVVIVGAVSVCVVVGDWSFKLSPYVFSSCSGV